MDWLMVEEAVAAGFVFPSYRQLTAAKLANVS